MNILIVDDEEIIRNGVKNSIQKSSLNFENIYEAKDAKQVYKILEEFKIDIILMDINLPFKNGLELSKEIKKSYQDIIIGIISGYDYFDYMREAIKIGVDDYILKPTSKNDIIELVKRLTQKKIEVNKNNYLLNYINTINEESTDNMDSVIEENIFNKDFTLSWLADKLGFNISYLSTLFKKKYGLNFQNYTLKKRMEKASILLISTNLKIYEIADAVGFDSVYYFNIRFKKYFKKTPNEYKKGVLNNEKK